MIYARIMAGIRLETAQLTDLYIMGSLTRNNYNMIVRATQGLSAQEFMDFCAQYPETCRLRVSRPLCNQDTERT